MRLTKEKVARMIDHTLLKPDASSSAIERLCREAMEHELGAVCVNPCRVRLAGGLLSGSKTLVAAVVGFPLGASKKETKVAEARSAIGDGAEELDMVAPMGALKDGFLDFYREDIEAIVELGKTTKVIIETCFLTEGEIALASRLCVEAGAQFVKTSTGFGSGGAKVSDIRIIRNAVGEKARIKASGGIKTFENALEMIRAGADRIGTSSGVEILKEFYEADI
jgi:deoxyribose-phosphate aldolase